jgi:hypothetical protein
VITSVKEDFQAREADQKLTLQPFKIVNTYKRRFIVQTNAVTDDGFRVRTTAGVPVAYSIHPSDPAAWCNDINAKPRQGHPTCWEVVVSYTSDFPPPPKGGGGGNQPPSPASMPTQYGISYTTVTRVLQEDQVNGGPVVNSANEQFDPPLEYDKYLAVYTATVPGCEYNRDTDLTGCVNDNRFTINGIPIDIHTALARVRQTPYFQNGVAYWNTTYELTVDVDGWAVAPLDQGTRQIVTNSSQVYAGAAEFRTITDKFNQPLNHPANLNGAGQLLAPNKPPVYLDGTHGLQGGGYGDFADIAANDDPKGPGGFNRFPRNTFPNL